MKGQRIIVIGAVFACACAAAAWLANAGDLPERWRSFRYSRAVAPSAALAGGPSEIRLPWEIFAHCATACQDVRLVDAQGAPVPYELRIDNAISRSESHSVRVLENSFVPGKYTQIVGDLGADPPKFDRVRVETGESDFILWAELALSDDARTWRVVEPRAALARFRRRSVDGTQTIPFQGLNSRYVRVRVFETQQQFSVNGLTALNETSQAAELSEVPGGFRPAQSEDGSESAWDADSSLSRIPISQLRFATDTAEFYRAVRVASSEDGKIWSYRGSGVIYRYKQGAQPRESLAVAFPEWPKNYVFRVAIINGDDRPLDNVQLKLYGVPRRLLLRAQAGASYRLLYGNERAGSTQYDIARYLEAGPEKPVYSALSLGPEEITNNYLDPRPFSERHPEVLWLSLGIAMVLVGLTALKTLRTSGGAGRQQDAPEV